MYKTGQFLGESQHIVGEYYCMDTNDGDTLDFPGKEWINHNGKMFYQLVYHGGLVSDGEEEI
jgi:hypothetical protein